jgi:hypothetical protein
MDWRAEFVAVDHEPFRGGGQMAWQMESPGVIQEPLVPHPRPGG